MYMSEYAELFWEMPVNASGMDFTHKCRHFPSWPGIKKNERSSPAPTTTLFDPELQTLQVLRCRYNKTIYKSAYLNK